MTGITDEYMQQMLLTTKAYTVVILKAGPNRDRNDIQEIIWEHARRNFELRDSGILSIVCPVRDGSEINGIGIFNTSEEETIQLMDDDPGVREGIFIYEIHPVRSFPGDMLSA